MTARVNDSARSLVISRPGSDLTPLSFFLLLQFAFADFNLAVFDPPR
jgi:hypothetical protein